MLAAQWDQLWATLVCKPESQPAAGAKGSLASCSSWAWLCCPLEHCSCSQSWSSRSSFFGSHQPWLPSGRSERPNSILNPLFLLVVVFRRPFLCSPPCQRRDWRWEYKREREGGSSETCVLFLNPTGALTQADMAVTILYAPRFASPCGGGTGIDRCTRGNFQPAQREARLSLPYENMSSLASQDVFEKVSEGERWGVYAAPPFPTSSSSEAVSKMQHDS